MPNHIQNWISAEAEVIAEIRAVLCTDEGVDFNQLIRMPAHSPHFIGHGGLSFDARQRPNWYDWSCDYWGTKWNAYSCDDARNDDRNIYFQTAWSMPKPIFFALAARVRHPFRWAWADEDFGSNLGVWHVDEQGDVQVPDFLEMPPRGRSAWAMELHGIPIDEQKAILEE